MNTFSSNSSQRFHLPKFPLMCHSGYYYSSYQVPISSQLFFTFCKWLALSQIILFLWPLSNFYLFFFIQEKSTYFLPVLHSTWECWLTLSPLYSLLSFSHFFIMCESMPFYECWILKTQPAEDLLWEEFIPSAGITLTSEDGLLDFWKPVIWQIASLDIKGHRLGFWRTEN